MNKICPICDKELKEVSGSWRCGPGPTIEKNSSKNSYYNMDDISISYSFSHYRINLIQGFEVETIIIPGFLIGQVIGDDKAKIYEYPYLEQLGQAFIMEIPSIPHVSLKDLEKLSKRLSDLVIFS